MKKYIWIIAVVAIILVVGGALIGTYNSLVTKSTAADAQWSQVETQYQRRYDLIPNLVSTVKGFMKQELAIFTEITAARAKYGSAATTNDKAVAAGELETAISRLLVIVESNPEIKSNTVVSNLMDELTGTENQVSVERGRYNVDVRDYNTAIKTFPRNLMAGMFGFEAKDYFTSVSEADQAPTVQF